MATQAVGFGDDFSFHLVCEYKDVKLAESRTVLGGTSFHLCQKGGGIYYMRSWDNSDSRIIFPEYLEEFVEEMCMTAASVLDADRVQEILDKVNAERKKAA